MCDAALATGGNNRDETDHLVTRSHPATQIRSAKERTPSRHLPRLSSVSPDPLVQVDRGAVAGRTDTKSFLDQHAMRVDLDVVNSTRSCSLMQTYPCFVGRELPWTVLLRMWFRRQLRRCHLRPARLSSLSDGGLIEVATVGAGSTDGKGYDVTTRGAISVVIPTRNRPDYLNLTLGAVLNQRDVDLEVVIVDDGSELDIGSGGAPIHDPRVRVQRHNENRGVSAARNTGITLANGQWIAFNDDDDIWAPDKLSAQLAALASSPTARWSCAGDVHVDDNLRIFQHSVAPRPEDLADVMLVQDAVPSGGSGVVADLQLVRLLEGFDESLSVCADYDLWIRLALAAPLAPVGRPLTAYRVHHGGLSQDLDHIGTELEIIDAKYDDHRARRGVARGAGVQLWIGDRCQRAGHRVPAARAYLRSSPVIGRSRAAGRAAEALAWPSAMRFRDARRARRVPGAWLAEAEGWLAPVREIQTRGRCGYSDESGT